MNCSYFLYKNSLAVLKINSPTIIIRARTINRKLDQSVGSASNPTGSSQVLENRLFPIIAHTAHFVQKNIIFSTKHLLTTKMTNHSTAADTNKEICLPYLWVSCLFSPPHPGYVAYYTCIDMSDFQNGTGAVPTLYFAILPGSVLACFEGYIALLK